MALNFIETKNSQKFTRREILIGFVAILAIAINFIFPVKAIGESFWTTLFIFLVFPLLAVKYILKEPLASFGLSTGNKKMGIILSVITVLIFVLLNYYLVSQPRFQHQLTISPDFINNFWSFLLFTLVISSSIHFFWEFFFRGFIGLGLEKKFGIYAIPLQAALQSIAFFKNSWLLLALIFFSALAAGVIARQSRSVLYSFLSMWLIALSLDIMIIRIVRLGIN
ncbi:MAG: CPBP family glutamic-type intramembrane protease [Candidatus Moraniibacteriota bacterium]